jgi:hypothetical protein
MSRIALPVVLSFAFAAGCASHADELVDYRVTGGVTGGGDGTSLQLNTDGVGTRTSKAGGTTTVTLDATALADLNGKITAAQFATLQPSYGCHGCADQLVYRVAVQLDGRRYEVTVDAGETVPDGLHALLTTLVRLAPP